MIRCGQKIAIVGMVAVLLLGALPAPVAQAENGVSTGETATSSKDAVMIIRFNQKFVYFENSLKKVVDKVSGVKPNARYELQSVVPNDNNSPKYLANLRSVVAEFGKLGVSKDSLSISTVTTDLVENQEINIFVR